MLGLIRLITKWCISVIWLLDMRQMHSYKNEGNYNDLMTERPFFREYYVGICTVLKWLKMAETVFKCQI